MNTTAKAKAIAAILQTLENDAEVSEAIETLTHALACHIADVALERGKGRGIPHFQHVDALVPEVSNALRDDIADTVMGLLDSPWYDAEGNVT